MPNDPNKHQTSSVDELPKPQELQVSSGSAVEATGGSVAAPIKPVHGRLSDRLHRVSYRPSHRATFIGLTVVVIVLAINVGVIAYFMQGQDKLSSSSMPEVAISGEVLNSLGVNRTPVTNQGVELTIGPNSKFNGKVEIGGDTSISGQLQLNNTLTASKVVAPELQGGRTALAQLDVNGDTKLATTTVARDLSVNGTTKLQGALQVAQLLTVSNNANIAGNLAVGGTLSVRNFHAASLTSETTLTIGGHVVTRGNAPSVSVGSAAGSNGTVSISGNDTAGTVAVNMGVGAGNGTLANVSFTRNYGTTPHVVITPVGMGGNFYVNRNSSGFSINVSGALPPAGVAFDYIVMQ